jgi:hypothetical protein
VSPLPESPWLVSLRGPSPSSSVHAVLKIFSSGNATPSSRTSRKADGRSALDTLPAVTTRQPPSRQKKGTDVMEETLSANGSSGKSLRTRSCRANRDAA